MPRRASGRFRLRIRYAQAVLLFAILSVSSLHAAEEYTYWVQPCPTETARSTDCEAGDPELARWALEAWQRESAGAITVRSVDDAAHARFRVRWANANGGLYGETEPMLVDGKRGANIYVLPSVAPGADKLLRDAIVYLTCLHESGHAFGLAHTRAFADIMYSFQYGGDIAAYFGRYRALLKTRADIAKHSGISDADRTVFRAAIAK